MTYTPNVPRSDQTIANSQTPINDNFMRINAANDVNHVPFNAANFGRHQNLQVPEFTATTSPGTSTGEMGQFVKLVSGVARFFFQQENEGTGTTGFQISGETPDLTAASGHFFLPGGLEVKFGVRASLGGNASANVTYSGSNLGTILLALGTVNTTNTTLTSLAVVGNAGTVDIRRSSSSGAPAADVSWMVIGILA